MTSLGSEVVWNSEFNTIILRVSGDLSHSYDVVPLGQFTNVGLGFITKERAIEFATKTGKLGWKKQAEEFRKNNMWYNSKVSEEHTNDFLGGKHFEYLPEDKAKEYLKYAYGDYAEKLKKKFFISKPIKVKSHRRILKRFNYQRGRSKKSFDKVRKALPPGKRRSTTGKIYWETRKNRSDTKGGV